MEDITSKQVKATSKKRKRSAKAKQADKDESEERFDKPITSNTITLRTRMSPLPLKKLLKHLTNEQKKDVKDIGFDSMLKFQLSSWDSSLTTYLVNKFDVYRCALKLEDEEMFLTEDDVQSTLGLPRGQIQIVEGSGSNATEEYTNFLTSWKARWSDNNSSPLVKTVVDSIIENKEHGEMFKRDFVVVVVSTLLKGHTNRTTNSQILYSLMNVDNIKNLNWSGFIFQTLVDTVDKWKKNRTTIFTGPLVVLLVAYLDRVQFKGQQIERKYPAISNWTSRMVHKRIQSEKDSGGFGRGKVLGRILQLSTETHEGISDKQQEDGGFSDKTNLNDVQKISTALKKIADAFVEFGDVMADVGNKQTRKEIIKKAFGKMSDMLGTASPSEATQPSSLLEDDPIFNDEAFIAAIQALEDAFTKTTTACPTSPN